MVSWIPELPANHGEGFRVCYTAKFSVLEPVEERAKKPLANGGGAAPVPKSSSSKVDRALPEVSPVAKVSYRSLISSQILCMKDNLSRDRTLVDLRPSEGICQRLCFSYCTPLSIISQKYSSAFLVS